MVMYCAVFNQAIVIIHSLVMVIITVIMIITYHNVCSRSSVHNDIINVTNGMFLANEWQTERYQYQTIDDAKRLSATGVD